MNSKLSIAALLALLFLHSTQAFDTVLSIHGSGTTNPIQCLGSVMEQLEARTKLPVRFTYRGVGSSTGIDEFINDYKPESMAHYGMSEIPISTQEWQTFQDKNITILQLPAVFGPVSFFHSIPDLPNLNLTSCLLARIFTRDIKDWAHPDIREINPGLTDLLNRNNQDSLGASLRIRVARRELGSSSTFSVVEYLNKACPRYFPESMVSALPEWPVDTVSCRQNSGMLKCIEERPGTIGYIDAGQGLAAGLQEISIKNKYGTLLTSRDAIANGGVGARPGVLPTDPSADFGAVSLMNQDGEYAWPITLLTYLFVRLDLSFMDDLQEQSLLIAFLKTLYDPYFVQPCVDDFGFTLASGASYELGQRAIEMLEARLNPLAPIWNFESKPQSKIGAGDYVISSNRRSFSKREREATNADLQEIMAEMEILRDRVTFLSGELSGGRDANVDDNEEFGAAEKALLWVAVIAGLLALVVVCAGIVLLVRKSEGDGKPNDAPQESAGGA